MKTTTYPIPHDDKGGTLFLFGKSSAARIVLFCAGWPDDQSSFVSLAKRLADEKGCFVGVACLPGYDKIGWKDGYAFKEWASCLQEATKVLRQQSTTPTAKFTGVYHDWGCAAGAMFTTRALQDGPSNLVPDEVILFDIGLPPHPKVDLKNLQQTANTKRSIWNSVYKFMVVVSYQSLLAQCYLIQYYLPASMAGLYFKIGWTVLTWIGLMRMFEGDRVYLLQERVQALGFARLTYMAYPYYNFWKALLSGQVTKQVDGFHLPLDMVKTPVLFLLGASKAIDFHDATTEALFEREESQGHRSKLVKVENAGHWLYIQQEDVCFQEMVNFLGL